MRSRIAHEPSSACHDLLAGELMQTSPGVLGRASEQRLLVAGAYVATMSDRNGSAP